MLTRDELGIIHLVLNTDCNAWDLPATTASPGVCRFCYRERNRVQTDTATVARVIDRLRQESQADRIVFTGGDPLMPYDNHLEAALQHARSNGFETNLHTNGLLLQDRYAGIREFVSVYSLAVDGPDAETADWFRGQGYFQRFHTNATMLAADQRALAFNTFTTEHSVQALPRLARLIGEIADATTVEYWLISQYRPIGRATPQKAQLYGFGREAFLEAVNTARALVPGIPVFDQPTREAHDTYPLRIWVLADGTVTADLGSVTAARNAVLGNLLADGFEPLVRRAFALRAQPLSPKEVTP
ncbi:radical SAM protein [Streptomyces sp. IBSNAI002]|uniref:radical SAM protein n=1 Tax=Streptomyces sp. IBSNAI002 TaxID=3457500 RepID=UPI003FD2EAC2